MHRHRTPITFPVGAKDYADLWKFDFTTNMWTFMQGLTTYDKVGSYPTAAFISGPTLYPASHSGCTLTLANNYLYLFGGGGYGKTGAVTYLNDFWRYNLGTNEWQWLGGTLTAVTAGVYGAKGTSTSTTFPGSRKKHAAFYDTASGICVFGGIGVRSSGGDGDGEWSFDS